MFLFKLAELLICFAKSNVSLTLTIHRHVFKELLIFRGRRRGMVNVVYTVMYIVSIAATLVDLNYCDQKYIQI